MGIEVDIITQIIIQEQMDNRYKVVIVGHSGVGKTSIIHRYLSEDNDLTTLQPTLGAVFQEKVHQIKDGERLTFEIWDTAGQERYRSIAKIYYKDAKVVLAVYDVTNQSSFEEMKHWIDEVRNNASKNVKIVIVGNKTDLINNENIPSEEFADIQAVKALAQSLGAPLKLTSAQDNQGIQELFDIVGERATEAVVEIVKQTEQIKVKIQEIKIESDKKRKKGCCV